jgi:ribosome-binding factor A
MYKRSERLKSLFLHEVNLFFQNKQEIKKGGLFTITGVELTDDSKLLKVYFSFFGDVDIEEKKRMLDSYIWDMKQIMKKRLKLKIIPNIIFAHDETPEKANRIEEILKKIDLEKRDENS